MIIVRSPQIDHVQEQLLIDSELELQQLPAEEVRSDFGLIQPRDDCDNCVKSTRTYSILNQRGSYRHRADAPTEFVTSVGHDQR
ncbi:hypothetical protein GWI33_008167 [Rhynchophorus ferrugineus]|uniref:Uncharacterized protein n=1 Tax=Rhynchophorus ferrugineus TaxID=354439 RepID=A0A834MHK8_RHYFE|nr:hypothetical protein GWI33_008167 [Rhynchophorus ferrugineus]